jgi:hypothetical protein
MRPMTFRSLLSSSLALAITLALAGPALAQKPAKGSKTDPPKTGDASASSASAKPDDKSDEDKDTTGSATASASSSGSGSGGSAAADDWDVYDVAEKPGKSYFFVGLRYRGNIIPQFMLNIFVDEGKTIYTNMIGAEFDLRKDGFSLIPALSYHELGTGDILFHQKGTKDVPQNYSVVNSSMKIVYATADLLWSTKISKNVEFEYGAGFGIGAVFGDLSNNWVQGDPNGPLVGSNGQHYSRCQTVGAAGTGCNAVDHQNSQVNKVGNYTEPSWFNGGSKPAVFPWLSVPQIGLRIKPIKNFVGRVGLGFALTGFWFGINAEYGLEKKPE